MAGESMKHQIKLLLTGLLIVLALVIVMFLTACTAFFTCSPVEVETCRTEQEIGERFLLEENNTETYTIEEFLDEE